MAFKAVGGEGIWLEDTYSVLASVDFDKRELNERCACIRGAVT